MGPISETYRYIVPSAGVRSGNAIVEGTRIAVHDVIGLLQNGETVDPRVFISHSALDADWARSFAQALKARGVSVWFDEFDVSPGESLREGLESGLRGSDVFVALLDPEYPAKPNLFFELGAAIGMGKRVVPIVPKGLDPKNLPLDVRLRRYLVRDSPEHAAEELSNALLAA